MKRYGYYIDETDLSVFDWAMDILNSKIAGSVSYSFMEDGTIFVEVVCADNEIAYIERVLSAMV